MQLEKKKMLGMKFEDFFIPCVINYMWIEFKQQRINVVQQNKWEKNEANSIYWHVNKFEKFIFNKTTN